MADIKEVERQIQFYYCVKELKRHRMMLCFDRLDAYEVLSRDTNAVICEAGTLDELVGFCKCLESVHGAKSMEPEEFVLPR